ncbi:Uncharacterized protein dnm_100440 [Desulfonema magnum]|uniref:Uncharacterized protein n=1 Tax=Desulfonema magnum TaxID=45655 RepID=A0A975BY11_9BACT|nr:Uncharacterized protein dnm_100440 [Desulfonema magnum]
MPGVFSAVSGNMTADRRMRRMSRPGISGKSLNPMSYSRASPESVIIRKKTQAVLHN